MSRTKTRRPWIKIYTIDSLDGSIRYQLKPDERSVWYDLLLFSAICANPGEISDKDGRPYPLDFVANRLNIPLDLLQKALDKCEEEGRISTKNGVIKIVNWAAYQSEYQRQKPYRADKKVYSNVVRLRDNEYKKLVEKFGEMVAKEWIEKLSLYIQSKGDKYKSHYYTIISWDRNEHGGKPNEPKQKRDVNYL